MINNFSMLLIVFMFLLFADTGNAEQKNLTELNINCPAERLCPDLEKYYQACKKNPDTKPCVGFVELMKQLSPTYDCSRSFDKGYIVPAIWLCDQNKDIPFTHLNLRMDGEPYTESYYKLLSELNVKEAREYFASPLFRSVLDGHPAEEYYKKSEMLEKFFKK